MTNLDDKLAQEYLAECREHLAAIEMDLLDIESGAAEIDQELVNRVFWAVNSVKEGAGVLQLVKVRDLARQTEDVLALMRSHKLVATPGRTGVLLRATDRLHELVENSGASNQADIAEIMAALASLCADRRHLRTLLAEDDSSGRLLLQTFLSRYGECHVAANGKEAVEAFCSAFERGESYDLICMDIMMPVMDGREAVRRLRALEDSHGIPSTSSAKIVMTTTVSDIKAVFQCFKERCDAYLVKPIDLAKLLSLMKSYQLVR